MTFQISPDVGVMGKMGGHFMAGKWINLSLIRPFFYKNPSKHKVSKFFDPKIIRGRESQKANSKL